MAKHLQQLDLFGNDTPQPVHIAAPASTKNLKKPKPIAPKAVVKEEEHSMVAEETLPTVSRTSMHYKASAVLQKRGRNHRRKSADCFHSGKKKQFQSVKICCGICFISRF